MYIETRIWSRNEMLSLAYKVGEALREFNKKAPVIFTLTGANASGKSIFALATDEIYNPDSYPDGIEPGISADDIFNDNVVFHNFRWVTRSDQRAFDQELYNFEGKHPAAKVLIASNLDRNISGDFNYSARGLCSKRLDMNIDVQMEPGTFTRRIGFTVENEQLADILKRFISPASQM